ncbi:MAG: hypothetical protein Ta2F_07310 [Termitinemataceae bacterium]|nr:MAG: hypothetical protein Ta2F_07310 [Termitinemataceae bacterium]
MYNKLTLNIEQNVIENARIYAKNQKRSISKLVEDYLSTISSRNNENIEYNSLGPITKELVGVIKIKENDKESIDYKDILTDALMEKYL